ncbi:hypothetical protein EZS27_043185, partial [termite gut metagenome]
TTWSLPITVLHNETPYYIANAELYQLANGVIVIGGNGRSNDSETIVVSRSLDNGDTWLPQQTIYESGKGCWEPAFLQLTNGELQVYFADEAPYPNSSEQEIAMLSSTDNGETWTKKTKTVCFRVGRRDGMPVPIIVNDEILVAIEDNKVWETMKPYIVRNTISDTWERTVLADSPNR